MAPLKEPIDTRTQQDPASGAGLWGQAPYAVLVIDTAGTVVDLNPAAEALLGGALRGAP